MSQLPHTKLANPTLKPPAMPILKQMPTERPKPVLQRKCQCQSIYYHWYVGVESFKKMRCERSDHNHFLFSLPLCRHRNPSRYVRLSSYYLGPSFPNDKHVHFGRYFESQPVDRGDPKQLLGQRMTIIITSKDKTRGITLTTLTTSLTRTSKRKLCYIPCT